MLSLAVDPNSTEGLDTWKLPPLVRGAPLATIAGLDIRAGRATTRTEYMETWELGLARGKVGHGKTTAAYTITEHDAVRARAGWITVKPQRVMQVNADELSRILIFSGTNPDQGGDQQARRGRFLFGGARFTSLSPNVEVVT